MFSIEYRKGKTMWKILKTFNNIQEAKNYVSKIEKLKKYQIGVIRCIKWINGINTKSVEIYNSYQMAMFKAGQLANVRNWSEDFTETI